jgi:hypothetical protein
MINLIIDWIKALETKTIKLIIYLIIFIIILSSLPFTLSVLPFTYLAL